MNNDLISREALKKALIEAHINRVLTFDISTFNCVMSTIDNAPTVSKKELQKIFYETAEKPELKEVIAYECGKASTEREQGEWIDCSEDKGYVECPFCHKQITGGDLNFCVKCGADMRKGDES